MTATNNVLSYGTMHGAREQVRRTFVDAHGHVRMVVGSEAARHAARQDMDSLFREAATGSIPSHLYVPSHVVHGRM